MPGEGGRNLLNKGHSCRAYCPHPRVWPGSVCWSWGTFVVVAGRVRIGFSEDAAGLPARLIGPGLTVKGFVLLVGLSPALFR